MVLDILKEFGIVLLSTMYFAEGAENLLYSTDEVNEFFAKFGQKDFETEEELLEYIMEQWRITLKSDRPKDEAHVRVMTLLDMKQANNLVCV